MVIELHVLYLRLYPIVLRFVLHDRLSLGLRGADALNVFVLITRTLSFTSIFSMFPGL